MKLNDFEKWYFDLKGFFVIKNAVSKSDIIKMKKYVKYIKINISEKIIILKQYH